MEITDALRYAIDKEDSRKDVSTKLGITVAMISHYLKRDHKPRLDVAARIWGHYGYQVEPFTEKAVIAEWTRLCSLDNTK